MAAESVIPTLGNTAFLKDPEEMIAYTLRQYAITPKNATVTHFNYTISMAHTLSMVAFDKTRVNEPITLELTECLNRIFPHGTPAVSVSTEDVTESRYSIVINAAVVINGLTYGLTQRITVDAVGKLVLPDGVYNP